MNREASAPITPKRQRSQYTCMATSLSMALEACGIQATEDEVNKVMGAAPMQGASWEQAFAAAQHFGARTTLICPATLSQVKAYTDRGVAVMIAWNPEGRPWSHASVIFDVTDTEVHVADPNIPDPDQTVRVISKADFYGKWYEKWESYLVRRPAMAVEREVSPEGRQMVASRPGPQWNPWPQQKNTLKDEVEFLEWFVKHPEHLHGDDATKKQTAQAFKNLAEALKKEDQQAAKRLVNQVPDPNKSIITNGIWAFVLDGRMAAANYSGNPGGKAIYPNTIDHGTDTEPLAGGTDVMRQLQNQLLHEQGHDDLVRPVSPSIAKVADAWWGANDKEPTPFQAFFEYMNANAVHLPKGQAWWIPGRDMAVSVTGAGVVHVWQYTVLPLFPVKRSYKPATDTHPAGIIVHPAWVPHPRLAGDYKTTIYWAEQLVDLMTKSGTLSETVKAEMKWVKTIFHTDIPTDLVTRLAMEAPKVAVRRWGTTRLQTKDVFMPFDGTKPVPLNTVKMASPVSVAARYTNAK